MIRLQTAATEEDYRSILRLESTLCSLNPERWHFHFGGIGFERYMFGNGAADFFIYGHILLQRDAVIGYALIYREECEYRVGLLPQYAVLYPEIVAAIEKEFPAGSEFRTDVNNYDAELCRALLNAGYKKGAESRFQAVFDLRTPQVGVQPFHGHLAVLEEADIPERVRYAALPTGASITAEMFEAYLRSADCQNVLDYVFRTEEGAFAGYLSWWMDRDSNTVMLNPVACVEQYRKRGYTQAAISQGLQILKEKGFAFAYVDTGMRNLPAKNLYQKAGFLQSGMVYRYSKE